MNLITIKAHAKVNLSLDILGRRENGYHDVEMIMQQVTLFDDITLERKPKGITIEANHKFVPNNSKNIAYQVAEDMIKAFKIDSGLHIIIKKRIPVAAGLAGGSADAAAVIKGMNTLFDLGLSLEEMKAIGLKRGADIPFCIEGGAAVARGIGEDLEIIPSLKQVWMVLCKPPIGVSTQEVYKALDVNRIERHPDTALLIEAMTKNDYKTVANHMYNVLEEVTGRKYSIINTYEKKMREYGAIGTMMSGSGPTVFGIFKNYKQGLNAYKNLSKVNQQVYLVQTYHGGANE